MLIMRKFVFRKTRLQRYPQLLTYKDHEKTLSFSLFCTQALNNLIEANSVLVESRNSSARGRHFFLCPEWRMGLTRYVYMRDLLLSGTLYHIWTLQEFFEQNIM